MYECFVMDQAGFLIMHKDFLMPSATAAEVEHVHITQKEKTIVEDLITKGYLIEKECRNLEEIKKQSFYEVNLPLNGVDALKNHSGCPYELLPINKTNVYLGQYSS